jgi:hypothetical protein
MRHVSIVLASTVLAIAALSGCSNTAMDDSSAPVGTRPAAPVSESAKRAAEAIKAAIPEITDLIALTPSNDTNNLLGRPDGYSAAIVLTDSRASAACSTAKPGVDCGATIEQWPDAASAQKRADHVEKMRGALPGLGPQYSTVKGGLLLQVAPLLEPAIADAYRAAFLG